MFHGISHDEAESTRSVVLTLEADRWPLFLLASPLVELPLLYQSTDHPQLVVDACVLPVPPPLPPGNSETGMRSPECRYSCRCKAELLLSNYDCGNYSSLIVDIMLNCSLLIVNVRMNYSLLTLDESMNYSFWM